MRGRSTAPQLTQALAPLGSSAAVGHTPNGADGAEQRRAAMVVTTDAAVGRDVVNEIVASDGFVDGWSVDLG